MYGIFYEDMKLLCNIKNIKLEMIKDDQDII
jgi:hypothetical protein